jgi:hypothetical protein
LSLKFIVYFLVFGGEATTKIHKGKIAKYKRHFFKIVGATLPSLSDSEESDDDRVVIYIQNTYAGCFAIAPA